MLYIIELVWKNPETHNFLVEAETKGDAKSIVWKYLLEKNFVSEEDIVWNAKLYSNVFRIPTIESPIAELP